MDEVCIVLTGPADRAFVSCYSTTDAFTTHDIEEQAALLEGCTHFHLGGYFNMKGLQTKDFTEFVKTCRERKLSVSLNTQSGAQSHDMWPTREVRCLRALVWRGWSLSRVAEPYGFALRTLAARCLSAS